MDSQASLSLESRKRVRGSCSSLDSASDLVEYSRKGKKICDFDIREVSMCSILDDSSEAIELFAQSELDEAQEELLCGVMKSLEEELVSSDVKTSQTSPTEGENNIRLLPPLHEEFYGIEAQSCSEESSTPKGKTYSLAASSFWAVNSYPSECDPFHKTNSASADHKSSTEAESESQKVLPSYRSFDIDYLLAASDDELGILPSPRPDSLSSQTEMVSDSLQETGSLSNENDSIDLESWLLDVDSRPEDVFDMTNSGENYVNLEWFQNVLSPVETA